jgi:hypothetical protein
MWFWYGFGAIAAVVLISTALSAADKWLHGNEDLDAFDGRFENLEIPDDDEDERLREGPTSRQL